MAVAWGDAWTNMIQPFWALPALGIELGCERYNGVLYNSSNILWNCSKLSNNFPTITMPYFIEILI